MKRLSGKTNSEEERSLAAAATGAMLAGKTYPFQLAFTNPLYDPIQVRLSVQRHQAPAGISASSATTGAGEGDKVRRPPFAVSLPSSSFPVGAFAEAWEYEDDEDMFGIDDDEDPLEAARAGRDGREAEGKARGKAVGVLEKKANMTLVGGEVVIGREGKGDIKVCPYFSSVDLAHVLGAVQLDGVLYVSLGRPCSGR